MRTMRGWAVAAIVFTVATVSAGAQDYPNRFIRAIVGPGPDIVARLFGPKASEILGQQMVIEPRPGAGGVIAAQTVAAAAPDGYTLLFAAASTIVLTPQLQKLSFDPMKQLVPITNMGTGTQMVAIKRALPVTTLSEFIAYAKNNPGKLNFTVAGTQNISHLAPVLPFARAGVNLVMVPARGEAQAIYFQNIPASTPKADITVGAIAHALPMRKSRIPAWRSPWFDHVTR